TAGALGAGTASAAPKPASAGIKITAPAPASAVTAGPVAIRLQAGTKVTGIEAFIGTRDISSRFRRQGSTWTAKVARRLVGTGPQRLLVQAMTKHGGGGTASETFVVGRPDARLLSGVQTDSRNNAKVRIAARTRAATVATLTINGH